MKDDVAIAILKCPRCGSADLKPVTGPDGEKSIQCDGCFHCGPNRMYFRSAVKAWNDAARKANGRKK